MHNIKEIRENPDKFQENLKKRYVDIDVKKIISLDENNGLKGSAKCFNNKHFTRYRTIYNI